MKKVFTKILYSFGILKLLHIFRNRNALTVVLFHRVLPVNDPIWDFADRNWTVSDIFFEGCLEFFNKHYNFITQDDIIDTMKNNTELPPYPLLITFDDGWSDNEEFAAAILRNYNVKPLLFVTITAINTHILSWKEAILSIWKSGRLREKIEKVIDKIIVPKCKLSDFDWKDKSSVWKIIKEIQNIEKNEYDKITSKILEYAKYLPVANQMLNWEQLQELCNDFMDIGTHGMHHEPIDKCQNPDEELLGALEQLEEKISTPYKICSMSFPHGSYDIETIIKAINSGYKIICGGLPVLNRLPFNRSAVVLGRLNICQPELSDTKGGLKKELLATYLFRQPHGEIRLD